MIMVRTLRKDIAKYNRDEDLVGLFIKHFAQYAVLYAVWYARHCDCQSQVVYSCDIYRHVLPTWAHVGDFKKNEDISLIQ